MGRRPNAGKTHLQANSGNSAAPSGRGRGGRGARGGRGGGRGGRDGGRGGGGRKGGRGGGKAPDWTCGSCSATVFGSKDACFKCGTPKGGGGGGGGSKSSGGKAAVAATGGGRVVDSVEISLQDRALIRDLMDESDSTHTAAAADASANASAMGPPAASASVRPQLAKMGFAANDLDRCADVCGGLRTMAGALNWLLIHVPEERIPKAMTSTDSGGLASAIGTAGSGGSRKSQRPQRRVLRVHMDTSRMSDAQKVAHWLVGLGFDPPDCQVAAEKAFKPRRHTDALVTLYSWYGIEWNWKDPRATAGGTEITAALKLELRELQARHPMDTQRFRILGGTRNDAWRLRCPIGHYRVRVGTDFTQFNQEDVGTWVRSVAIRYNLEPGTVRKVCSSIPSGKVLGKLTAEGLRGSTGVGGWGLQATQADGLARAIASLKAMCYGDPDPNEPPDADSDSPPPEVRVDLSFYWPKILEPGRRTARASRYPFETPLAVLSGWDRIEAASGVEIPSESKLAATKALCTEVLGWVKGAKLGHLGGPLLQRAADWLDRFILELVPQLQEALAAGGERMDDEGSAPQAAAAAAAPSAGAVPPDEQSAPGGNVEEAAPAGMVAKVKPQETIEPSKPAEPARTHNEPLLASRGSTKVSTEAGVPNDAVSGQTSEAAQPSESRTSRRNRKRKGGAHKEGQRQANAGENGEAPPRDGADADTGTDARRPAPPPGLNPTPRNEARAEATRAARKAERERLTGLDLQQRWAKQQSRPKYKEMLKGRMQLPAMAQREEVVDAIRTHQVTVISGATGCGKSTQVPQFVLDDLLASGQGGAASLVCTQPRRLAAIGVSERVASERDEECGQVVGYQIRLEQKRSKATRLLFCTTGILLRTLETDGDLNGLHENEPAVTHVFVDEVHERSIDSDFLLVILRGLLSRRPDLKLILMSATLNAKLFATYFGAFSTTVIDIPGRTFPVSRFYLEDAIEQCGYKVDPKSDFFRSSSGGGGGGGGKGGGGSKGSGGVKGGAPEFAAFGESAEAWVDSFGSLADLHSGLGGQPRCSRQTAATIREMALATINFDLVAELVAHLALKGKNAGVYGGSAILVFVPGLAEITDLFETMKSHPVLKHEAKFLILPLHSQLPTHEQRLVFDVPPKGVTKIVLSTNIAETSVTINDISCVVDAGTHKEMQYDSAVGMSCLREVRVSKANAAQRAGRAGRVREGYAYHLFLSHELEEMPDQQLPEMLRCPLESVALRIKTLRLGKISDFLAGAIEPPSQQSVDHVIAVLNGLAALDVGPKILATTAQNGHPGPKNGDGMEGGGEVEELTPLGVLLAGLPVDPRIGKMLIFGTIFRCLDPTVLIAASLSFRSPFFSPFDKREEADAAKRNFDPTSDHITVLQAYLGWRAARENGKAAERDYLQVNFLSRNTLQMIEKMAGQFRKQLQEIGVYNRRADKGVNENSGNLGLVKAVLVAGLYPNVVKIEGGGSAGGAKGGGGKGKRPPPPKLKTRKIWEAGSKEEAVALHPGSVLGAATSFDGSFLVFHEKVKTSQVYIRDASVVSTFALLLFGGAVEVEHMKGQAVLDGWLRFGVAAQHAAFIVAMRAKLQQIMQRKIDDASFDLLKDPEATKVTSALSQLMSDKT